MCRSTRRRRTRSPRSASRRCGTTRAAAIRPARRSSRRSHHSRAAARSFAFASGLGAETTLLLTLHPGDHVVLADDVYGGTYRLLSKVLSGWGLMFSTVDLGDLEGLKAALTPADEARLDRDPVEPAAEDRGHRSRLRDRARPRRAGGRGQHVRDPRVAATTRPRRRRSGAQRDEVHRRALRPDRRRHRHQRRGVDRAARLPRQRGGCGARTDGLLPRAQGAEDARRPHAGTLRRREGGRRLPRDPSGGDASLLPGARGPPGP